MQSQIARGIGELFGAKMSACGWMKRADQPETTQASSTQWAIQKTALMRQPDSFVSRLHMNPHKKAFKLPPEKIRRLIPDMGGCYASDRITVDGSPVGYMYREEPDNEIDSGWRFFAGDESQEYADTPDNFAIYEVNTICNYDPAVIPYLNALYGSAFGRIEGTERFEAEDLEPTDE